MTQKARLGEPPGLPGGYEVLGDVTIKAPAGPNGARAMVSVDQPALVTVAQQGGVYFPAGTATAPFKMMTKPVAQPTTVTVTATGAGETRTTTFVILPPALVSIALSAPSAIGGDTIPATATFTGPPAASNQTRVTFEGDNYVYANSVTLPVGQTVVPFTVKTRPIGQIWSTTLRAVLGADTLVADVKVLPPVLRYVAGCGSQGCYETTLVTPISSAILLSIRGRAPAEGVPVRLTSSKPNVIGVPQTLTIPAGDSSIRHPFAVPLLATTETVQITGTYRDVSYTWMLKLVPPNLTLSALKFFDRYQNEITQPPDGAPFKACVSINNGWGDGTVIPPTVVRFRYQTSTGLGRTQDLPLSPNGPHVARFCGDMGGLEAGQHHDVEVTIDPTNAIVETDEKDNLLKGRIARP